MGGIEEETAAAAAGPADSTLPNAMGLTTVRMPSLEQHDEGGGARLRSRVSATYIQRVDNLLTQGPKWPARSVHIHYNRASK